MDVPPEREDAKRGMRGFSAHAPRPVTAAYRFSRRSILKVEPGWQLSFDRLTQERLGLAHATVPLRELLRGEELLHPLADRAAGLFELRDHVGPGGIRVL